MNRSAKAPKPQRYRGHATPNESPRQANYALLMTNLGCIAAAGHHAIVELRGFGLHELADALKTEVDRVRVIHVAAEARVQSAMRIEVAE